jgi:cellulose synthase/poly-beta-1,6-N-acetylglucosamine synthase-like glycosyltransferase
MKTIFWFTAITIFYLYFGYPAGIYIASRIRRKAVRKEWIYPSVSILMSVYNDEAHIEEKIKSLLAADYPKDKIEILIGSDGSTDRTEKIISTYVNDKLRLYCGIERKGKPSMLNILASRAKGDIFVFTDVRQELDRESLKELISNFADETVGSVSTELHFKNVDNKSGNGIGFYWRYEKFIRNAESGVGSMLGATGAMYAIRRDLFTEIPAGVILDDMYVPLKAIEKGYRAVFDSDAKIYDHVAKDSNQEFLRKARTHSGNFQVFGHFKHLFNPLQSPIAIQLISHKWLRLMGPYLLALLFISNAFLLDQYLYVVSFALQSLFYVFAAIGTLHPHANRLFDIPHMFCVMNAAAVVGLWRFLTDKHSVLWDRAEVVETPKLNTRTDRQSTPHRITRSVGVKQ